MNFKAFSPHKYLFIITLTVSIKQCEKVNLFKPNTPQRQKHSFVSNSPYCPVVRLNGPRAYIRTPLYAHLTKRSREPCEHKIPGWHQKFMFIHHVPEYVRRTGIQLGSTYEQVPKSQHTFFDIFYHMFKANCTNSPVFREHFLNAVLHYNSWHF